MADLLQHTFVTLVALGAFGFVVRRVVGFARPKPTATGCPSCAARKTCAPVAQPSAARAHPVKLIR